jgi:mannose/cellobiose epimerase-like protein (N-acyl-D-glucosamine 2-epimerase family)
MSIKKNNKILSIAEEANDWLFNAALPIWYDKGVDWRQGGFFESLEFSNLSSPSTFKRTRVLTRQIYVFSYAVRCGNSHYLKALLHGIDFLLNHARLPSGGFASKFSCDGTKLSNNLDFYDLSFCLFALAHAYRVLADVTLQDEAIQLVNFIHKQFVHQAGGFVEGIPACYPRRQNPHMHFLEALLEWRSISDHPIFIEASDLIISIFYNKFYDPISGALFEYYDDELNAFKTDENGVTEPGHHFEWFWLIARYKFLSHKHLPATIQLYKFAHNYGFNISTKLLWSEVSPDGRPMKSQVRLWPHTEWIKAELVADDQNCNIGNVINAWSSLKRFLDCPRLGLWYETFDHKTCKFVEAPSPASSLYHIVLAIAVLNQSAHAPGALYHDL